MSKIPLRVLLGVAGAAAALVSGASAQTPVLLKDVNPAPANPAASSHPIKFTPFTGGRALFMATTSTTGYETYITNGTAAGTSLVSDLLAGPGSSIPVFGGGPPGAGAPMVNFAVTTNGIAFFFANNGSSGWELHRTDGTSTGTTLVRDINPGTFSALSTQINNNTIFADSETTTFTNRPYMKAAGNRVYFGAVSVNSNPQLWASDGTLAGTVNIGGNTYQFPRAFTQLPFYGNRVLFSSGQGPTSTWEILDPADDSVVSTGIAGSGTGLSYGVEPLVVGDKAYFVAQPGTASNVYSIDSTGTVVQVSDTGSLGSSGIRVQFPITIVGTKLFYIGAAAASGTDLMVTDLSTGVANSTLIDINPGAPASFPRWPTVVGNTLYFTAQTAAGGLEVWKSDGTQAGTTQVTNLGAGALPSIGTYVSQSAGTQPMPLRAVGTKILFSGGSALAGGAVAGNPVVTGVTNLMVIDTAAGDAISDASTVGLDGYYFTSMGSYVLASANSTANGREVWRSDATPAGTSQVSNVNSGVSSSGAARFTALDANTTIFTANSGAGETLWRTSGNDPTTVQLGVNGGFFPTLLTSVPNAGGNRVYAGLNTATGYELGFTDGVGVFVFDLDPRPTSNGQDGAGFPSIVYTGGTPLAPTTIELEEDTRIGFSADRRLTPGGYTDLNGAMLFMGQNATSGRELFTVDITGAALVSDIFPGDDGAVTPTNNGSLGFLNAAPVGGQANFMMPNKFFKFNNRVYFAATDGVTALSGSPFTQANSELYVTDGTTAGTVLASDINPGLGGSDPHDFVALSSDAFLFYARGDGDDELWRGDVDPTTGVVTTTLVLDINPGGSSWAFWPLVKVGSHVYFAADDGTNGRELWKSDGTPAGTVIVADLNPGPGGSLPGPFLAINTPAGERLFVYADDGTGNGRKFYTTDGVTMTALAELNVGPGNDGGSTSVLPAFPDNGTGTALDMTMFDGKVYFPGNNGVTGLELWSWDGQTGTFALTADLFVGGEGSAPQNLFANGSRLYFTALNNVVGREPYVIDLTPPVACLADLVGGDGNPPADGSVDGNDFSAFLNAFGAGGLLGDLVGGDGNPPADGSVDGNDFSAFLNAFGAGC